MKLLKEGNLGNKVLTSLLEEDSPAITTFVNKYKPLYDLRPEMRNNALFADQIQLRGSGISKRVEATYTPGCLKMENEEWGFYVYNGEVDTDSMENMSQYWFYDDYRSNPEFKAKIDKAAIGLYNDMDKLYKTMANVNEALSPEEELSSGTNAVKSDNSELKRIKSELNSLVESNACLEFGSETPVDKVGASFSYQRWLYYKQSSPARKILLLVTVSVPEKWVYVRLDNGKGSLNPLNTDFIDIMNNLQKIFSSYTLK